MQNIDKLLKYLALVKWIGLAVTVLVVAWWAVLYYFVGQQTGEPMTANLVCMVFPSTDCNLLRGMAWLRGITPYEPFALWWAASVTALAWWARHALLEARR